MKGTSIYEKKNTDDKHSNAQFKENLTPKDRNKKIDS